MLNFPYCVNISPMCFFNGVDIVKLNLSVPKQTVEIRVSYTFNHELCTETIKIVDKRRDYATNKTYQRAFDEAKKHLLYTKVFDLDHYSTIGGFLSKQTWEDNIKFCELPIPINEMINKLVPMIQQKAPFFDRSAELRAHIQQEALQQAQDDQEYRQQLMLAHRQQVFAVPEVKVHTPIFTASRPSETFKCQNEENEKNKPLVQATQKQTKSIVKTNQTGKDRPKVIQRQPKQAGHVQKAAPRNEPNPQHTQHISQRNSKQAPKKILVVKNIVKKNRQ